MESFSWGWEIWEFLPVLEIPQAEGDEFPMGKVFLGFHCNSRAIGLFPLLPFLWKSGNSFPYSQGWNFPFQRGGVSTGMGLGMGPGMGLGIGLGFSLSLWNAGG